jgi:hypothetical protein
VVHDFLRQSDSRSASESTITTDGTPAAIVPDWKQLIINYLKDEPESITGNNFLVAG